MRHAPFAVVVFYIFFSKLVFWFGPMPWPVINVLEMVAFQVAAMIFLVLGYLSAGKAATNRRPINLRPVFLIGIIGAIALQIPLTLTYTGKYPWDVFSAILDQRMVYEDMLEQLVSTKGERFYVPLVRSVVMPLFLASVGYGFLNFRCLSRFQKILLYVGLLCPIDLSLLRGTDKEIADLIIIICGFLLVAYCRRIVCARQGQLFVSFKLQPFATIAFVVFLLFLILFSYRKFERLGGAIDFCIMGGLICADYSGPILSLLPDFVAFGYVMTSVYFTNGYYGLSLALELPFESAYGLGHSSALLSLYERISGSATIFESTYIARISESGWDHRYYWSSLYTWLANDVHFVGALIIVGLLARWFRQAWLDAVYARNDLAAVVFVLLCIAFLYLPANNQLAQTFDLYFAFIGTFVVWKFRRGSARRKFFYH
ncbi:MAG: hypothetical protein ACK4FE_05275 [Azonexus sp.]